MSGGAGSLLGPQLTHAAIDAFHPLFSSTDGHAAMWPVIGTSALLSIAFLRQEKRANGSGGGQGEDDAESRRSGTRRS